jgi:hypothetical protein
VLPLIDELAAERSDQGEERRGTAQRSGGESGCGAFDRPGIHGFDRRHRRRGTSVTPASSRTEHGHRGLVFFGWLSRRTAFEAPLEHGHPLSLDDDRSPFAHHHVLNSIAASQISVV